MDDPTRIPAVTRLLRMAWEAQPGLTLPQVFGLLEARGIGWGSTDGEVRAALTGLLDEHPYQLRGHSAAVSAAVSATDVPAAAAATGATGAAGAADVPPTGAAATTDGALRPGTPPDEQPAPLPGPRDTPLTGRFLVETEQPAHRVTVDPWHVGVRRTVAGTGHRATHQRSGGRAPDGTAAGHAPAGPRPRGTGEGSTPAPTAPPQPVAWRYRRIRACRAGEPLVVTDAEGIDHRLGLVARISVIDHTATPLTDLTGLRRDALADRTFLILFDDGSTALVDRSLWVYEVGRRDISHRRLRWRRLSSAAVGAPLVVQQQGAAPATLGTVAEIVRLA
ncbi:hypothetical protein [Corynebacterium bovis]|uniref:Uncharacterized protein n=1 Tax=Corynebacterium bovis DSM 20582 = CIP 54.80 TaxID=927655 RepID=A0A8H9Y880_9CORY|nr:hypothetical protein [Corynebacterium bovis]MBB3115870.1 hypothetical protein [Corynebacterium bovis DSM 20582 = CIP 54.80]RRO85560.1 hypothetical protein CXF45_11225 [Corynebacterium bovis]RRQ15448.1 hypothetical protein CXF46_07590 [Corynebacterium bovis]WJY78505.1 hypothetical protein CBOVI_10110 [Corynebacterium bovis DSM 20582 = CIP 54.80]